MGPWSDAPRDILQAIAEKLNHHSGFLHFGAVCKPWRSVYEENHHRLPYKLPMRLCHPRQLAVPLLLRSYKEGADSHEFICLSDEKVHGGFFLPEAINKRICGSSWGWLVTVDIGGEQIHLLNPFTRAQIRLPPLGSFTKHAERYDEPLNFTYIYKAIISADPTTHSSDCVVLAITGDCQALSYCRVGDTKWTNMEESPVILHDMIYNEGILYVIDDSGIVMAFDSSSPDAVATIIADYFTEDSEHWMLKYLVMSSGVLLRVVKVFDDYCDPKTNKFNVYKLQKSESPICRKVSYFTPTGGVHTRKEIFYKWVKLESLGDQMLLLGTNSSMSLPAHLFPNFKSNCIYFTDDFVEKQNVNLIHWLLQVNPDAVVVFDISPAVSNHDEGIFDLHDGSIQSYRLNAPTFLMPSIWVTPNVW